jgi:hypothetical protein
MVNPQLLDYIKQQLAANVSRETIKSNLIAGGGWSAQDLSEAFSMLETPSVSAAGSQIPQKRSSRKPLLILILTVLLIGAAGLYGYYQKNPAISITSPALNLDDVRDFDTCIAYIKNAPTNFDIVFTHGSDFQGVEKFAGDFKAAYPRAVLETSSETDYLNNAVEANKSSIYTESQMTEYKKMIEAQADSKVSIKVPLADLGTKESFKDFMTKTLASYPSIDFKQYAGSSPEDSLDPNVMKTSQQRGEKQCEYTYKQLTESERAAIDIKGQDAMIRAGISGARVNASMYYDDNGFFATGTLSLNNGVCSDTGTKGLKKTLDYIAEKAGSVYCYASATTFAVSAPLKSTPTIGYCVDSTGFSGTTSSPTAASKGSCLAPVEKNLDIGLCEGRATARERWICVGDMIDPYPYIIGDEVSPYARPNGQKVDFCKTFKGVEADYCFASIVKSESVSGFTQEGAAICALVSNQYPWFKKDCVED